MSERNQLSLDLGFNRDLLPHEGNAGKALLTNGFTMLGIHGNPVLNSRHLRIGDRVRLTLYDLTSPVALIPKIETMSFSLKFMPARNHQADHPVEDGGTFERFDIFPCHEPRSSTVFDRPENPLRHRVWFINRNSSQPSFPNNQLSNESKTIGEPSFIWRHEGHFYYTLELDIGFEGEPDPKRYRLDPEMIITEDGDGDLGGEPRC